MSRRAFWITGLLLVLVLAGVGSFYASSNPDGLEYVAGRTGFLDTAEESHTSDGPFADYSTKGIEDARLSGGVAGVVGCLLVLSLMSGLAYGLRRRRPAEEPSERR